MQSFAGIVNAKDVATREYVEHYGVCSTKNSTAAKAVTIPGVTDLHEGEWVIVKFANAQTYNGAPTLNVNGLGAINIKRIGTTNAARYEWQAGEVILFVYDGTYWVMLDAGLATTTYYGVTKLYTGATSTSEAYALTPKALNSLVQSMIANIAVYSSSATYAVGDRVRYSYQIWVCNTAIDTAEAWNAEHWTAISPLIDLIDQKANADGCYENLTSGAARQLVSDLYEQDSVPYTFRASGGYIDLCDRATDKIVGGTIVWNQLVDTGTTSVTVPNGHKYAAKISGSWTVAASDGTALSVGSGDQVFDLTQMFGSAVADHVYALEQANTGAGVLWFRKLFPKDNYAYNAGELLSVNVSAHNTVGFNAYNHATGTARLLGGNQYQITGTYSAVSYTDVSGNSETLTIDGNGKFTPTSNGTLTVTGGSADDTCVHLVWSGYRNGDFEPYRKQSYVLDSSLTLRGIPKLDANNRLYYDGDTYASDGTVTRKCGEYTFTGSETQIIDWTSGGGITYVAIKVNGVSAASGTCVWNDPAVCSAMTTGGQYFYLISSMNAAAVKTYLQNHTVKAIYRLATATVESAAPYVNPQIIDDFGTEEYVDYAYSQGTRDVAVPVGHETQYLANLRDKLQKLASLPATAGDYVLRVTVTDGQRSYAWVENTGDASAVPASASVNSSGLITFSNSDNTALFTLQLPLYNGYVQ